MKAIPVVIAIVAVLTVSFVLADNAFAAKSGKEEVQSIMTAYQKAINTAQKQFKAAIEKAQSDARNAIAKGIPTDQINAQTKEAISKARIDLKTTKDLAQKEAKKSLEQLKTTIKP